MTKNEVSEILIKLFKKVDAVDPNLSNVDIGQIKLPNLDWLKHDLGSDPDFKKEVLFKMMENTLKNAHPNNITPEISPQSKFVFEKDITIDELATQISRDIPDEII